MTEEMVRRVKGMILGLVSRGQFPHREPVAYLYNVVRLPKLPEWDAEAYPYACIIPTFGAYFLDLWPVKPVVNDKPDSTIDSYGPDGETVSVRYCTCYSGGDQWGEFKEITYSNPDIRTAPFWTNTDLYTTDGKLYLAKSDPVPVYE